MKTNLFLVLALVVIFFPACRQEIQVKVKGTDKIVVHSDLEAGRPAEIYLTQTLRYYQYLQNSQSYQFIKDATVKITGNGTTETLTLASRQDTFPWFDPNNPQITTVFYYTGTQPILPETNYELEVVWKDKKATASTRLPKAVQLKDIRKVPFTYDGFTYYGYVAVWENPNIEDFAFKFDYKDVTGFLFGEAMPYYKNNTDFYPYRTFEKESGSNNCLYTLLQDGGQALDSMQFRIRLLNVDKNWATYAQSLADQSNTSFNPLVEPTVLKSNIKGDGIGVFGGYTPSEILLKTVK